MPEIKIVGSRPINTDPNQPAPVLPQRGPSVVGESPTWAPPVSGPSINEIGSQAGPISDIYPAAGAIVGSLAGAGLASIPGAALGASIGESLRQIQNSILGVGKTLTPRESLMSNARAFGIEGGKQALGMGIGRLGNKLLNPITNLENPATAAVSSAAERQGIPMTLGQQMDSTPLKVAEFLGTLTSAGRKAASDWRGKSLGAASEAIDSTLADLGSQSSNLAVGARLQNITGTVRKNIATKSDELYSAVDQITKGVTVDTAPAFEVVKQRLDGLSPELKKEFGALFAPGKTLSGIMDAFSPKSPDLPAGYTMADLTKMGIKLPKSEPPQLSFGDAHALRSKVLEIAREDGSKDAVALAKSLSSALDQSMSTAAKGAGEDVYNTWRTANEFYKNGQQLVSGATFRMLANKDPEQIVASIKPGNVTDLQEIKQAVLGYAQDQPAWDSLRRQWIQDQLRGPDGGLYDLRKLPDRVAGWGKDFTQEMFNDPIGQKVLSNIQEVASVTAQLGNGQILANIERLGEAHRWVSIGVAAALGKFVNLPTATLALFGPTVMAKALYSEAGTQYLIRGMRLAAEHPALSIANFERAAEIAIKGAGALREFADSPIGAKISKSQLSESP